MIKQLGVLIFIIVFSMGGTSRAQSSWQVTSYQSVAVEEPTQLLVAGINFADYGYRAIYSFVLTNDGDAWVIGIPSAESSPELSLIRANEHQRMTVTTELGWPERPTKITFFVFYLNDLSDPFVLIEHVEGNVSRETDETETHLDIFRISSKEKQPVHLQHELLAATHIYIDWSAEAIYRFSDFSDNAGANQPGKKSYFRYLLSDANADGYADLLIWEGQYTANTNQHRNSGDFFLSDETLSVMYFEPKTLTFLPRMPFESSQTKGELELLVR